MISRSRRDALVLAVAMAGTAALAALSKPAPYGSGDDERIDLDQLFPQQFGVWRVDEASRAFVRPALRAGQRYRIYDQVLERTFINDQGHRVMLSVAFGSEQSASLQLHRPEVCYRAGGFEVSGTHAGLLTLAGRAVPVTRLVAKMPGRIEPITYWTILGGEVVSDPGDFRWRRLSFAARRKLLDGMLVRVSSIDSDSTVAFSLHGQFVEELLLALPAGALELVIGSAEKR
jgi:EpsI family protein